MRRYSLFSLITCLSILLSACNGPAGDIRGATPVGYREPILTSLEEETAETVEISDLLESPEAYRGQLIEVSGTYQQRQVVVCSTRPQRSPAEWALSDGLDRIPAGGMNDNLQDLPPGRIDLTVIGIWLLWQGPVGCGRQAQVTDVWYLEVTKVISPNPITIAAVGTADESTTTSTSSTGQTTDPADPSGAYPGPQETSQSGDPTLATPFLTATLPVGSVGSPGTPVFLPTASPTTPGQNNPSATPTLSSGGTSTTATATTAANNSASPTATTPSATATNTTNTSPTATTTGGGGGTPIIVDQERLPAGSIESAQLGPNEIHRWPFVVTTTAVITVNIASDIPVDASITIQDALGNVVATQNKVQNGAPEILPSISLGTPGTYDILITSENDTTGYYAILVLDEESYTFVFNDTMAVGDTQSSIMMKENNDHFWFFSGTAGQTVTIRVTPSDTSDLFIRLFGPNDTLLIDFHDETGDGEVEEILSFTLPDTGIYSILVGEYNFGTSNYSIVLVSG